MIHVENVMPRMVLTLGLLTFFAIVIKKILERSVIPALPVYLVLGIVCWLELNHISMAVASKGLSLGNEVMSNEIFSALVVVVAVTSVVTPNILSPLIDKWINNKTDD